MSGNKPLILDREELDYIRYKLVQRVWYVFFYTGVWAEPAHPYLRSHRLVWGSSSKPGTIVAKHLPLSYSKE